MLHNDFAISIDVLSSFSLVNRHKMDTLEAREKIIGIYKLEHADSYVITALLNDGLTLL